jgi:Domain of unknown function (DUF4397)
MTTSLLRRIFGVTALIATTFGLVANVSAASAATPEAAPAAPAAAAAGWARFGHFAPSAEPVDVWVDGVPFASTISFKNVSSYKPLGAGPHRFELRSSSQPNGPALIDVEAGVPAGGSVTVSAVTTREGIASQVYDDALMSPPAGEALVRFIHAAPDVQAVDVRVINGPTLAATVPYPAATSYQAIAGGQYDVEVLAAGTKTVLLQVNGWSIEPGAQSSIVIVRGLDGKIDVAPLRDAAAVGVAPAGGVQTGYGSMAPNAPRPATALRLAATLVTLSTVGVSVAIWVRRRSTRLGVR